MNLSIIAQDGTIYNYTNSVQTLFYGEFAEGGGYGFMALLSTGEDNIAPLAEYTDEEEYESVKNELLNWLKKNIYPVFEFPQ